MDYVKMANEAGIRFPKVRCDKCFSEREADGAKCLRLGWPECCGYTMTLLPTKKKEVDVLDVYKAAAKILKKAGLKPQSEQGG